ncbi:MAG: DUF58 domain-containing protein [Candidatus Sumerlaeia bacterium]
MWLLVRRAMFQTPYYRLTLEGFLFLLVTLFIGFAAFNTDINLLYLILSLMCAFMIVSGFLSTISLRPIRVERQLPHHLVAGEVGHVRLQVHNPKRLFSSYSLKITDHLDGGAAAGRAFVLAVPPRAKVRVSYPCLLERRGVYYFRHVRISSRFPFGFFERSAYLNLPEHLLVYPQSIDLSHRVKIAPELVGERESARKGQGSSLYGLRAYTTSDSARAIHWKVSARADELMVREFESEHRRRFILILNNHPSGPDSPALRERFEKAVILCASLARLLIGRGFQVQLITASGRVPPDSGRAHLDRILRALAIVELAPGQTPAVLPRGGAAPDGSEATCCRIEYEPRGAGHEPAACMTLGVDDVDWSGIHVAA